MPEAQKDLLIQWFDEVWNKKRREAIDELLPEECVIHDAGSSTTGPEEFKPFFDRMHGALSDLQITLHNVVSDGAYACARWSASMRHTGDGLGIPATGKTATISGITMARFANGRFVEAWQNWDMLGLLHQLQAEDAAVEHTAQLHKLASAVE